MIHYVQWTSYAVVRFCDRYVSGTNKTHKLQAVALKRQKATNTGGT